MTDDRYSRHAFLKEIGAEGQLRIAASRVFVIGAGGAVPPLWRLSKAELRR